MSRIYWVRHGPTHETGFVGHRDVPADLSDRAAIARLAGFLPDGAAVVSSDLSRAADTATALAGDRPRLPAEPGLREFDFGTWDGLRWDEVADRWPDLSRRYWEDPGDTAPPGGESWNAAAARIDAAVDALIAARPGPIVAVAHFGVILTQLRRALGVRAAEVLAHRIEPLSVTVIDTGGAAWRVERINHRP